MSFKTDFEKGAVIGLIRSLMRAGNGLFTLLSNGSSAINVLMTGSTNAAGEPVGAAILEAGAKQSVFPQRTSNGTPAGVAFGRNNAVFEASMVSTDASSTIITLFGTNEAGDITNGTLLGTFGLATAGAGTDKIHEPVTRPYLEVYAVISNTTGTDPAINMNWVG